MFTSCEDSPIITDEVENVDRIFNPKAIAEQIVLNDEVQLRSGGTFNLEEASSVLNLSLNMQYCRPGEEYEDRLFFKDSINVSATLSPNQSQIDNWHTQIANYYGSIFHGLSNTLKEPIVFHTFLDTIGSNIWLKNFFIVGVGSESVSNIAYPYGPDDEWIISFDRGKCDGTAQGEDAVDQWRRDLNFNEATKWPNKTPHHFLVFRRNIHMSYFRTWTMEEFPNEFPLPDVSLEDSDVYDPVTGKYHTWWGSTYPGCVNQAEMNHHYDKMLDVFSTYLENDEVFIQFNQGYAFTTSGPQSTTSHGAQAYIGEIFAAQVEEDGILQPLSQDNLPSDE